MEKATENNKKRKVRNTSNSQWAEDRTKIAAVAAALSAYRTKLPQAERVIGSSPIFVYPSSKLIMVHMKFIQIAITIQVWIFLDETS